MNERIKELYDQASIRYSVYEILKPRDERKSIPDIFAELIVRECGIALSPMLRDMVSRGQAFDLIKQHFGVEE